jgi:lipoyl(octanoyl) transferase
MRRCDVHRLHLVTYENGMRLQQRLVEMRQRDEIEDQLLLLEHPPVITLGRGGDQTNLLATPPELAAHGVRFYETTRGGDITYHGPGQLVAYPIVSLDARRDLHAYLRFLEDVLIATVARHGLVAARREGLTGIWIAERKLAAIGVAVRRWVTMHGIALNVAPAIRHFGGIVPCGIAASEGTVTSLALELGARCPSLEQAGGDFAEEFVSRWPAFIHAPAPA